MENNKEQAFVIQTGEIHTVESKQYQVGIELRVPDELTHIAQQMMNDINPENPSEELSNQMIVEMFYDKNGKLEHKMIKESDVDLQEAVYTLSNGIVYNGSELVVGLKNIRDYKLKQLK